MKTHDLLQLDNTQMAEAIKSMKAKECEKHAKNYAKKLNVDYDDFLISAKHAVLVSEQKASVVQRVCTNINELAKKKSDCTEEESEKLGMMLLMLIYKKTDGFKVFENLAK